MTIRRFALSVCAALACSAPLAAQADSCEARLVPYDRWESLAAPEWELRLGALTYLGAEHATDPAHPQFEAIRAAWREARPTVAFYEGPNRPVAASEEETIRQFGESGLVRFLAGRDGAEVRGLEPSPPEEMRYVMGRFPADQVRLFYVLREAARLRDRRGVHGDSLTSAISDLLRRASSALPEWGAWTVDDLASAYGRYWREPADWRDAPAAWFSPTEEGGETGGIFTNEINRASSEFRNAHMYRVLRDAVRGGGRVFAVVGRNHVAMQADALRCSLR